MPEPVFRFKKFTIFQQQAPFKVCTDSCILGALAEHSQPEAILDIGTGTGLLALMLAQKYTCRIDAVEIDSIAADFAARNFRENSKLEQIQLHVQSVQHFSENRQGIYDLIICNPPFYHDYLKSPKQEKNLSRHAEKLYFPELLQVTRGLIREKGFFYMLIPADHEQLLKSKFSNNWYMVRKTSVIDSPGKLPIRFIYQLSPEKQVTLPEQILIIKDSFGNFTSEFRHLLQSYYLHF
jgi:tRNA1Val (adenine37-N6)-methyltransferase